MHDAFNFPKILNARAILIWNSDAGAILQQVYHSNLDNWFYSIRFYFILTRCCLRETMYKNILKVINSYQPSSETDWSKW